MQDYFKEAAVFFQNDARFAPIVEKIGRPEIKYGFDDVFSALVHSVISQQISTAAAKSILGRLDQRLEHERVQPRHILNFGEEDFKSIGLSTQKKSYLINVADYFTQHPYDLASFENLSDDEIIENLTSIKGIGEWTVQMILIFTLHRKDVFPIKDLAVFQAAAKLLGVETLPLKEQMIQILTYADSWKPYRTAASLYLWSWRDRKYFNNEN